MKYVVYIYLYIHTNIAIEKYKRILPEYVEYENVYLQKLCRICYYYTNNFKLRHIAKRLMRGNDFGLELWIIDYLDLVIPRRSYL